MRNWLFYKIIAQTDTKVTVEFARLDFSGFGKHFPREMRDAYEFDKSPGLERDIERYVRKCGWIADLPRNADDEVSRAAIGNRAWPS